MSPYNPQNMSMLPYMTEKDEVKDHKIRGYPGVGCGPK